MANKINKDRYTALKSALDRNFRDRHVTVTDDALFGEDKMKFKVNWGALGSVTPNEAFDMCNAIEEAANVASALNDMALELAWEEDIEMRDLLAANEKQGKMRYQELVVDICIALEAESWSELQSLLIGA